MESDPHATEPGWWRDAIVYQVYLRSFADSDGDGTGDIPGLCSRLDYLHALGVDAIWVNPWYVSPLDDGGYDVADYRQIHPLFGDLNDVHELIEETRARGTELLVDLVPNHTSSEHEWFQEALRAPNGSPQRSRYHFRPGRGRAGELPPNDWQSVFGGPAWTRAPDGDWYLHLFDVSQPDLNWSNAEVRAEFADILRYWLELGVSGFRVDVAHGMAKHPDYPDVSGSTDHLDPVWRDGVHPFWDRPEVHEIVREWRSVVDEYEGVLVAEAWVADWGRLADYLRPGEYHQAFDFLFLKSPWDLHSIKRQIDDAVTATSALGASPTWVLSNHDVVRHTTRYGLPPGVDPALWLLDGDRDLLDEGLGIRRARAATLLVMALPGSVYLYQGEELGLPEVFDLPFETLDDPVWARSGHTRKGRDGCRVPVPWRREGPSLGFGDDAAWLPQPGAWAELSVEAQEHDPASTLNLYREAIRLRRRYLRGTSGFEWTECGDDVLGFRRGGLVCIVNFGSEPHPVPAGKLILASEPSRDQVLPDSAIWLLEP